MQSGSGSERGAGERTGDPRDRVERDLARLGVDGPARAEIAQRLAAMSAGLSPESYGAALAGVALACGVYRPREEALARSARELVEIERLLGAFGEELQRLEDALRALSSSVEAARAEAPPRPARPRVLH